MSSVAAAIGVVVNIVLALALREHHAQMLGADHNHYHGHDHNHHGYDHSHDRSDGYRQIYIYSSLP
jgi:ABC-type Zn2+ transport system substrate-binding protein/surface adhesin